MSLVAEARQITRNVTDHSEWVKRDHMREQTIRLMQQIQDATSMAISLVPETVRLAARKGDSCAVIYSYDSQTVGGPDVYRKIGEWAHREGFGYHMRTLGANDFRETTYQLVIEW